MKKIRTHVAIAGGGIGGLVMALQLQRRGIECMVFEAAEKLEPLGVGINLLPHSVKILAALGLLEELRATTIETSELAYFNKHGQAIWREPRGIAAGYDFPQFSIHRGELHMLLFRHAVERLGAERVLTGHAIKRFDEGGAASSGPHKQHATARFENRRTGAEVAEIEAELIIAADGIHSTVRSAGARAINDTVTREIDTSRSFASSTRTSQICVERPKWIGATRPITHPSRAERTWFALISIPTASVTLRSIVCHAAQLASVSARSIVAPPCNKPAGCFSARVHRHARGDGEVLRW